MQQIIKTKVTRGGRIVIPAEMRKKLGIEIGEEVNLILEEDALKISSGKFALQRIRKAVEQARQTGVSVVDELIAERRREAENE